MSPRKVLKRYLGNPETLRQKRSLGWLGRRLHDQELWHIGRHCVAGGVALGFFIAFIPLPIHMVTGALLAVALRVNLPVTIAAVWITNPLTFAPLFFFAYEVGAWLLGKQHMLNELHLEHTLAGTLHTVAATWEPLLLGCFVCGVTAAAIGYCGVQWSWRLHVLYRLHQRRARRLNPR